MAADDNNAAGLSSMLRNCLRRFAEIFDAAGINAGAREYFKRHSDSFFPERISFFVPAISGFYNYGFETDGVVGEPAFHIGEHAHDINRWAGTKEVARANDKFRCGTAEFRAVDSHCDVQVFCRFGEVGSLDQ